MILNFILQTILNTIQTIFSILPSLPATPDAIVSAGQWVVSTVDDFISVLQVIYGTTLLGAVVILLIAEMNFSYIYHITMWIIRKIPMINVK